MSFDWKTEESDWDKSPYRPAEPVPVTEDLTAGANLTDADGFEAPGHSRYRRRAFAFLAFALVITIALTAVIYRQIERRLAEGEQRAEEDVLASHYTVMEAARAGDTELFVGFLSGRDPQWSVAQTGLVGEGAFTNRADYGFFNAATASIPITPTVTLASDLNSAEVSSAAAYVVDIGMGLTETITLTQTSIYRRGPDRWLLAPPDPVFWGDTETIDGRYARLTFPARDSGIIRRLSRDLESTLADLCADISGGCPPPTITFSTDPATLTTQAQNPPELLLPTPTLLGYPVDDAGYRAVSRQYASRVVNAVTTAFTGGTCCANNPLYSSLQTALLSRLGLLSWQPTDDEMTLLLRHPAPLDTVASLWEMGGVALPADASIIISPFVDFLVRQASPIPIVEMQRLLVENQESALWDWLALATSNRYPTPAAFEREWLQYAARSSAVMSPPVAFPNQDLQLICQEPGAFRASLFRYDFQAETVEREHDLSILDAPMLVGLPGRDGVIVFGRNRRENSIPPYIWQEDHLTPITFEDATIPGFIPLPPETGAQSIMFFLDSGTATSPYAVLPVALCSNPEKCRAETVIGAPLPSPEGTRSLYAVGATNPLAQNRYQPLIYLGDSLGGDLQLIGPGWSPFWLNENSFGYIATAEGIDGQAVVIQSASMTTSMATTTPVAARRSNDLFIAQRPNPMGGTTGVTTESRAESQNLADIVISTADLAGLQLVAPGTSVVLDRAMPDPTGKNLFIFTANPLQPDVPGLALVYNLDSDMAMKRFEIQGETFDYQRVYEFSPDGRWLVVGSRHDPVPGDNDMNWTVYVHAVDGSGTSELILQADENWTADWLIDWTEDGRWLAVTTGGYVRIMDPGEDYSYPLVVENLNCTAAVWINEG